ncbi:hypothetical protein JCM19298_352 [Nonlabens ulvanivorans]|nr:triple tyrosine motif-containing protein [Nonlabens ulvanivorans]GAK94777.1 hypothetical protein JCM19298_352 [Nonlabens ulvanivorans]
MKAIHLLLLLTLFYFNGTAQELPPLNNYEPSQYRAGNQNWMLSESDNHYIYIANNKGLLEYNGSQWRLYKTPNESIMRSVKVAGDRIYTGCYMDFGYWQKDDRGVLNYTSIIELSSVVVEEDEQFWNIIVNEEYVLFQSLSHIYSYDISSSKVSLLVSNDNINKFFKVGGNYYYHSLGEGLFTISNQRPLSISQSDFFKEETVILLFEHESQVHFLTENADLYRLVNNEPVLVARSDLNLDLTVYNALFLSNGSLMLGTISNGVVSMSLDGTTNYVINQSDGLINNTCLTIFEDSSKNVWLGLDNGISSVNVDSAYSIYRDRDGELGTVYASYKSGDILYVGTNQGLFYKKDDSLEFTFIEGTQGQVWSITSINGQLYCNHHAGIFEVNNNEAKRIPRTIGTWQIHQISDDSNLLLAGTYNGLYFLSKQGFTWKVRNKIRGFNISSKDFVVDNEKNIYVNHEYKGVFKLSLNDSLTSIQRIDTVKTLGKGIGSDMIMFKDNIIYAKRDAVYTKPYNQNTFTLNEELSKLVIKDVYTSGTLVKSNGYLWLFNKDHLSKISIEDIDGTYSIEKVFLSKELRNEKVGYENLTDLGFNEYLIGSSYGYTTLNQNKQTVTTNKIFINNVKSFQDDEYQLHGLNETPTIPYKDSFLQIQYSAPSYNSLNTVMYQYRVLELNDSWSNWTKNTSVELKNLSYGNYSFEVRSRINESISTNTGTYSFTIARPYYLTNTAIAIYIILLIILIILLNGFYIWYFKRQKERALLKQQKELELKNLTNEKNLIELRNAKLRGDIEHRNKELAISTMAMIKKNETLNELKEELNNLPKTVESKSLKKMLDKNLNSKQDWLTFEEAFNNADKDFFKKIKELHPSLTSGDLRLCVYLRLNLSSKEIAPLLNISPRSVEIKRYRLRKKLDLSREDSLTSYIVEI